MSKILITGTGRCGTTFLIKLFSFLEFDTGFTSDNYKNYIFENCNAGMERDYTENYYILKNPEFLRNIDKIIQDTSVDIKLVIIPIRDYNKSALSRFSHKFAEGGLWNARYPREQIAFYNKLMADYILYMTKYEIPTLFLDFEKILVNNSANFETKLNFLISVILIF